MKRIRISSGARWEKIVGYSRLVRVGRQIFVTGTTATTAGGGFAGEGDAYVQTIQIIRNIEAALARVGSGLDDIVRTRMFVTDIRRDWEEVGRAHAELLGHIAPATTMVEVSALIDPRMLIEIEADAVADDALGWDGGETSERPSPAIAAASFNDGPAIRRLLARAGLPIPDDGDRPVAFLVARAADGALLGCVGSERGEGSRALLRSLAVAGDRRGAGIGGRLVEGLARRLADDGCEELYLLTVDAQDFFSRLGFRAVERSRVPASVARSKEFVIHACDGATVMAASLPLDGPAEAGI